MKSAKRNVFCRFGSPIRKNLQNTWRFADLDPSATEQNLRDRNLQSICRNSAKRNVFCRFFADVAPAKAPTTSNRKKLAKHSVFCRFGADLDPSAP